MAGAGAKSIFGTEADEARNARPRGRCHDQCRAEQHPRHCRRVGEIPRDAGRVAHWNRTCIVMAVEGLPSTAWAIRATALDAGLRRRDGERRRRVCPYAGAYNTVPILRVRHTGCRPAKSLTGQIPDWPNPRPLCRRLVRRNGSAVHSPMRRKWASPLCAAGTPAWRNLVPVSSLRRSHRCQDDRRILPNKPDTNRCRPCC